jgi:signal peptidase II
VKSAADKPMTETGADIPAAGQPGEAGSPKRSRPGRLYVTVLVSVAVFVLAADTITKVVVVADLSDHAPIRLLGGLLRLRLLRNSGAAFSIGTSMTIVFTAIAAGVIVFILRTARKLRSLPWAVTLGLLLGGATGNLSDRLFRAPGPMHGSVVDWIQLPHWPVFNLADSAIVCGGVLAVLLAIRGLRIDGARDLARPPREPGRHDQSGHANQAGPANQAARPGADKAQ